MEPKETGISSVLLMSWNMIKTHFGNLYGESFFKEMFVISIPLKTVGCAFMVEFQKNPDNLVSTKMFWKSMDSECMSAL